MEQSTRELSTRRRRATARTYDIDLSSSPARSQQSTPNSGKRKAKKKVKEVVYATKDQAILEEKRAGGVVKYLINWADHPSTGEVYTPSWEPANYVFDGAKKQWQEQKACGQVISTGADGHYILNEDYIGSEDNIAAKRKRDDQDTSDSQSQIEAGEDSSPAPAPKRARINKTRTSRDSSPELEVEDSYPQEDTVATPQKQRRSNFAVEIALPEAFDKSAYQAVPSSQTGPTETSSSQSEGLLVLEDHEDSIEHSLSPESGPDTARKSRAATGTGKFVVPDSQDYLQASESWEPSQDLHSISTTETSSVQTQIEEEEEAEGDDSLLPDIIQQNNSVTSNPLEATLSTSIIDFGFAPRSPAPQDAIQKASSSQPLLLETSPLRISTTPPPPSSPIRSLLTPTRQRINNHSSSPSSQILRGSDRNSQTNSSGQSQQQLPSPTADSRSNSAGRDTESISHTVSGINTTDQTETQHPQVESSQPIHFLHGSKQAGRTYQQDLVASQAVLQSIESPNRFVQKHSVNSVSPSSSAASTQSRNMDIEEAAARRDAERAERRARNIKNFDERLKALSGNRNVTPSVSQDQRPEPTKTEDTTRSATASEHQPSTTIPPLQVPSSSLGSLPQLATVPGVDGMHTTPQEVQQPIVDLSREEATLEEKEATDVEIVPDIEQLEIEPSESSDQPFDVIPRTSNEFFVALPFNAGCRDFYHQILKSTKHERQQFLEYESDSDKDLTPQLQSMVSTLELLCSHPDLHSDDYSTQRADSYITQAKFAENRSTKCILVAELIQEMRSQRKHIAIIARPGRMLEILEAVLVYHDFIRREDTQYEFQHQDALKVSLIPSDLANKSQLSFADLVIAFDSTFSHQANLSTLRIKPDSPLSPLVHLVVSQSVEHLQALFPATLPSSERAGKIIGCLSLIMGDVGKVNTDPAKIAKDIATFMTNGEDELEWPCQSLPIIDCAQGFDDLRSSASPVATYRNLPATSASATSVVASAKRQLEDDEMNVDSPKRQRLTPSPEDIDASLPDVPNSMSFNPYTPSQQASNLFNGTRGPSEPYSSQPIEARFEAENVKLRQQLHEKEGFEADLLRLNNELQAQLNDLQASLKSIQPKYQEAINERAEFEHKEKSAISALQVLQKNFEARQGEIATLKEQKDLLTAQLTDLREIMSKSAIPDISKLANLEEQVRTLRTDNEKLERQKQSANNDVNFMRDQYQTASTAVMESTSTTMELQAEIATLRAAASGERVRIQEIQRDQDRLALGRMVKQLKIEKAELQRELEKKASELATVTNGRRSTRGTSTPMSPRVMSPGGGSYAITANRGNLSRILQQQQARSRGNSPSVADRLPTNGGPAVFGDLLPPNRFSDGPRRG